MAEHAVKNAWWIIKLLRFGQVAAAVAAIALVMNGTAAAMGIKLWTTRDDVGTLRTDMIRGDSMAFTRAAINANAIASLRQGQDSIVALLTNINNKMIRIEFIQCLNSGMSINQCSNK